MTGAMVPGSAIFSSRLSLAVLTLASLLLSATPNLLDMPETYSRNITKTCNSVSGACCWSEQLLGTCVNASEAADGHEVMTGFCLSRPPTDEVVETERRILKEFLNSSNILSSESHDHWSTSWDTSVNHCTWPRVHCTHGRVTHV